LIAHVSAILLLPVFEKSVIFNDFRASAHSISAREGKYGLLVSYRSKVDSRWQYYYAPTTILHGWSNVEKKV